MKFQHDFDSVEDYLHHRAPYLMVDEVVDLGIRHVETSRKVTGEEHFFPGHFPGAPIVPGAMLQEMTTQSAGILIAARHNPMQEYNTHDPFFNEYALGVLIRLKGARFRGFVRPGDTATIRVEMLDQLDQIFEFRAQVSVGGERVMSNTFQLANILSSTLQGPAATATGSV